jgi:hypothetical protein
MELYPFPTVAMAVALTTATAAAHDWYSDLRTPSGLSCCSDQDCHRVGYRYTPERGHEIEIEGRWITIDSRIILPQSGS